MSKKPLPSLAEAVVKATENVTRKFATLRKREERHSGARAYRYVSVNYGEMFVKDAANKVMKAAYDEVTANGTLLPAQARQIMYKARPRIKALTSRRWGDSYFTQVLLPDYIREHGLEDKWDVVYKERGSFVEPHTRRTVGLGTVQVRNYLGSIGEPEFIDPEVTAPELETHGPECRFGAVLGIEKEGFNTMFQQSRLLERHDIGLASIVGQSTTAARRLLDEMCGDHDMKLFFVHDLDLAGFDIIGTLQRDTRRFEFTNNIEVIDVGLRLDDVRRLGIEASAEPAAGKGRKSWTALRHNLLENGATGEEVEFLRTKRVEINALSNPQLIELIERALQKHGIEKVVPDDEMLAKTYRFFVKAEKIAAVFAAAEEEDPDDDGGGAAPPNLAEKVKAVLKKRPSVSWDAAVAEIARVGVRADDAAPEALALVKKKQRQKQRRVEKRQRQIRGDQQTIAEAVAAVFGGKPDISIGRQPLLDPDDRGDDR